uniref:Receptor expression-enhancing protein n=1 Tax=Haemonchus contortus TaxID=6289 RepID=A0A7I4YCI6_HAECO|nr:TB2 DP1 and HVA22 related protein domain containing protein [Haemonchus contortus]
MSADPNRQRLDQFHEQARGMVAQFESAVDLITQKLQPLTDQMYDKDRFVEKILSVAEEKTAIKREKLVYGTILFLSIYVIISALAQIISNVVGFLYPAWRSIKAVRSSVKEDDTQWLIYWIVFATFSIIDFSTFSTIPFYWLFKIAFLMYLYLPMFNGATVIYKNFIDPACTIIESYFRPNEPKKTN